MMYHDVIDVRCLEDFRLHVTFEDGKSGILDCKPLIAKGGVFTALEDVKVFKQVCINKELGVLTWNDNVDIAPETVYSLATGSPLPDWMESDERVA